MMSNFKGCLKLSIRLIVISSITIIILLSSIIIYGINPENQIKHHKIFKPLIPYKEYTLLSDYKYDLIKYTKNSKFKELTVLRVSSGITKNIKTGVTQSNKK